MLSPDEEPREERDQDNGSHSAQDDCEGAEGREEEAEVGPAHTPSVPQNRAPAVAESATGTLLTHFRHRRRTLETELLHAPPG
jgi:hypothetical protein